MLSPHNEKILKKIVLDEIDKCMLEQYREKMIKNIGKNDYNRYRKYIHNYINLMIEMKCLNSEEAKVLEQYYTQK